MSAIEGIRDIHTELADLNMEAAERAAKIQENFARNSAPPATCFSRV